MKSDDLDPMEGGCDTALNRMSTSEEKDAEKVVWPFTSMLLKEKPPVKREY